MAKVVGEAQKIPVVEIFGPTVQGEGVMAGYVTWFVRVGACDYLKVCAMCDSMHAVDPKQYKKNSTLMAAGDIAATLIEKMAPGSWVTFSGGNPALWDLGPAVDLLRLAGYRIAVETQGSKWLPWLAKVDVLTISPKGPGMLATDYTADWSLDNFIAFLEELKETASTRAEVVVKIPIFSAGDLEFAKRVNKLLDGEYQLYLSVGNPSVHAHNTEVLRGQLMTRYERIIEQVLADPELHNTIVLPQLHVLVWGNKQGV